MQVSYQLTAKDYREGLIACRKRRGLLRWWLWFVFVAMAVMGLGALVLLASPGRQPVETLVPIIVLWVIWLALVWGMPHISARRMFRGSRAAQSPMTLEASDAGMHFRSEFGNSTIQWGAFVQWVEMKGCFALFTSPASFVPIPKRAFSGNELVEFRELLQRCVKP